MRRTCITAVLASAAFAAFASAGEEAKTYEIDWHEHWKIGQIATVTEHETSDLDTSMGAKSIQSEHEVFDATYVVRCDALDEKGDSSKRTFFFNSWKKTKDETTDELLSGSRVEVKGNVWKLLDGKTAGPLAKEWLDKKLEQDDDNPFSKLAPPKLAVGKTWNPDRKKAAAAFAKSMADMPFDAAGIEMEIKLVSVVGAPPNASGNFDVKVHLPIAGKIPDLPPEAVLLPGAAADIVAQRSSPLTKSTMLGALHMDTVMTMNIEMPQEGQKLAFTTKMKMTQDQKTVAGGEIPEPAKPDATKPEPANPVAPPEKK